jgi:phage shock protein B
MNTVVVVAIVFGSIVTIAGLMCGTVLVIIRMRNSGLSSSSRSASQQEATMIQEIYQGLDRMEKRIDALETILMDGHSKNGDTK